MWDEIKSDKKWGEIERWVSLFLSSFSLSVMFHLCFPLPLLSLLLSLHSVSLLCFVLLLCFACFACFASLWISLIWYGHMFSVYSCANLIRGFVRHISDNPLCSMILRMRVYALLADSSDESICFVIMLYSLILRMRVSALLCFTRWFFGWEYLLCFVCCCVYVLWLYVWVFVWLWVITFCCNCNGKLGARSLSS